MSRERFKPTDEDNARVTELVTAIGALCDGFSPYVIGISITEITAAWLVCYDRPKWPAIMREFRSSVFAAAEIVQSQEGLADEE